MVFFSPFNQLCKSEIIEDLHGDHAALTPICSCAWFMFISMRNLTLNTVCDACIPVCWFARTQICSCGQKWSEEGIVDSCFSKICHFLS